MDLEIRELQGLDGSSGDDTLQSQSQVNQERRSEIDKKLQDPENKRLRSLEFPLLKEQLKTLLF